MDKKLASFFCDPKKALKNIGLLMLMAFVVVYTGFQILPSFSEKLETETALEVSVFDANITTGYIFRDEEPIIKPENDRVVVTFVKDGERVSKGQHFANAYIALDYADVQEQIDVIDSKISILEKSSVETDAYVTDLSKTDADIRESFDRIYSSISNGSLADVNSVQNDLLVNMNKRNLIVNMSVNYAAELQQLRQRKNILESRITAYSDRVTAQSSGYYYGDTDGFERIFSVDKLDGLTHNSFESILNMEPEQAVLNSNYGKIVKDFVWYVVCESEKNAAAKYQQNKYYNLVFPSYSDVEMSLELVDIVKNTTKDTVLLVFRGNTSPEGFTYPRSQQVNIISGKYSGYAVPKNAVRMVGNTQGVYVLNGDIVRFRRIEILSEDGDYYIVKIPKASADMTKEGEAYTLQANNYPYLALYDNVIIGGKNLFDGKIVG